MTQWLRNSMWYKFMNNITAVSFIIIMTVSFIIVIVNDTVA